MVSARVRIAQGINPMVLRQIAISVGALVVAIAVQGNSVNALSMMVSPRKSRKKSAGFSSMATSTPARANRYPSIIPAAPRQWRIWWRLSRSAFDCWRPSIICRLGTESWRAATKRRFGLEARDVGRDALPTPVAKPPIIGLAAGPLGAVRLLVAGARVDDGAAWLLHGPKFVTH